MGADEGGLRAASEFRLLNEPKRPGSIREWPGAPWLAVGAVCVGAFMGQLDASIVTLALPSLQRSFDASLGAVTWVALSYLLVLVALVTAFGRVSDMAGRKLIYLYGFVVFTIGSALCGLAPTLLALDGARVIQAVGAAMLQANSVAIIVLAVPPRSIGKAVGFQGAAQAIGIAMGPTVGGVLVAAGGWRLIFFVNVPFGVIGLIAGWLFIPRSRNLAARVPFDWVGLGLFFPAVVLVLFGISFGNSKGWLSAEIVAALALGAALLCGFVVQERRAHSPMLDLGLFRRPSFALGISSGLLSSLVLFGVLFVVPFYFERSLGLGAGRAGLELMAMPFALGVVAPYAGRSADRIGARPLTVVGMVLVCAGLVAMGLRPGSGAPMVAELLVVGVGLGLFTPSNNASIMGGVPRESSGLASGVLNMTRGVGTALGLALTGLVFGRAGGGGGLPGAVAHAFSVSAYFLAAAALVAALLASLRPSGPVASGPLPLEG